MAVLSRYAILHVTEFIATATSSRENTQPILIFDLIYRYLGARTDLLKSQEACTNRAANMSPHYAHPYPYGMPQHYPGMPGGQPNPNGNANAAWGTYNYDPQAFYNPLYQQSWARG